MQDTIQQAVAAQAEKLGLTAYAVAKQAEMDPQTVKRYLAGRCALNSRYVSQICDVLGLELKPKKVWQMIRKAVLDEFENVVGFVEVENKVREIEVAGDVRFVQKVVETTDETWDKPDFESSNFDRTFEQKSTAIAEQLINVNTYKLSSAKKYQADKYIEETGSIAKCLTEQGETAYYFV